MMRVGNQRRNYELVLRRIGFSEREVARDSVVIRMRSTFELMKISRGATLKERYENIDKKAFDSMLKSRAIDGISEAKEEDLQVAFSLFTALPIDQFLLHILPDFTSNPREITI